LILEDIAAVGLRLSLDDELSLHCYGKNGGSIQLNDLSADCIDLRGWRVERDIYSGRCNVGKKEIGMGP